MAYRVVQSSTKKDKRMLFNSAMMPLNSSLKKQKHRQTLHTSVPMHPYSTGKNTPARGLAVYLQAQANGTYCWGAPTSSAFSLGGIRYTVKVPLGGGPFGGGGH